jgi:hypothetical protein
MRDASSVDMRSTVVAVCTLLSVFALARPLSAQCSSNVSSCVSCHETQAMRPVLSDPRPWHHDHGFGDLCAACHGGVATAAAKDEAHRGLTSPLADPIARCGGCHRNAMARAEGYVEAAASSSAAAAASAVTPGPGSVGPTAGGSSGQSGASGPAAPSATHPGNHANRALASIAALLALAIGLLLVREARDRGLLPPFRPRAWLRAKLWSPYAAGALLGVVVAVSESFFGHPIAASGAFDRLAAYPGRALFPHSPYYAYVMQPAITWPVWVIVGVLIGAHLAARFSGEVRLRWLPDEAWIPRFGAGRGKRLAIAFVGAMLVQIGAGIAGGCTSGLAISGGALLSPAAFLFMAGMFAGGIPTAWLWYRGGNASRGSLAQTAETVRRP